MTYSESRRLEGVDLGVSLPDSPKNTPRWRNTVLALTDTTARKARPTERHYKLADGGGL
jgi:hypothetical protein